MRSKFSFLVVLLSLLSVNAFGQNSVQITSKKLTHKKEETGISTFHKTVEIQCPEVTSEDAPLEEIRKSLSYWSNFEMTLEEVRKDGVTYAMSFRVNYTGKGILDVTLVHSVSAAYPSEFEKNVIIDLDSGESIKVKDAFENRTGLYNLIAKAHQSEVDDAIENNDEARRWLSDAARYFSIYEIEDFTVSDKGATFLFDYEFAHVIKAAQPEGKYFFSWKELEPFVGEHGPLAHFLEKN